MDPQVQLAFQFASDLSKQLLTLSTGILALTLTFTKDVLRDRSPSSLLRWTWTGYVLTIVFGIWHLMALTGQLAPTSTSGSPAAPVGIDAGARLPAALQILAFVTATIGLIVYVARTPPAEAS